MREDGATAAASGLFYQYLFTIETSMGLLHEHWSADTEIRIEDPDDPDISDPDIVDFSIYRPGEGTVAVFQAKSVANPEVSTISVTDALTPLVRLVRSVDCPAYVIITNARPGLHIERLNAVLSSPDTPTHMYEQLLLLVSNSASATSALSVLDADGLVARLQRARVVATGESASIIRTRLIEKITTWRNAQKLPLGVRAARILENSLVTQIFSRAAGTVLQSDAEPTRRIRAVTLAQFAEFLAESEVVLAQAAALVEAGDGIHYAPNGEGIARPELLGHIVDRFNNVRSHSAHMCVLVGPSGIGKTRLAAMFAHREHRSYDRVCWIDAESEASIAASITRQASIIGIPNVGHGDTQHLAAEFTRAVHRFIGRWLIVFDNAIKPGQLHPWITSSANADIIVTSINSVDWTAYDPIDVPGMAPQQALALLRSRLRDDAVAERRDDTDLAAATLAERLEYRPLAIQMAAAHFQTTSTLTENLTVYLDRIDDVVPIVFDDDTLDRDQYPHTLLATIDIILERLIDDASTDDMSTTALHMLIASSMVAPHRIPQALLYAAVTEPPETLLTNTGPTPGLIEQTPHIVAAVRRLRAYSLVEPGQAPDSPTPWELQRCININEIVQHVVRSRCELDAALNTTALKISTWIGHYTDHQDFTSAIALQPHALAVLSRASTAGSDVVPCAVLAGNEAALLDLQGRTEEAHKWLAFEWQLLQSRPEPHHRLNAITADQFVQVAIHRGWPLAQIRPYIEVAISCLQAWAADPGALVHGGSRVCQNLMSAIRLFERKSADTDSFGATVAQWRHQVTSAQAAFPREDGTANFTVTDSIEDALTHGNYHEALDKSTSLLRALRPGQHLARIYTKTQRVQALAGVDLSDPAHHDALTLALDDLAHETETHDAIVAGIAVALVNAAVQIQIHMTFAQLNDATLISAFRTIVRLGSKLCSNSYERYCYTILAACEASHHNDTLGVATLLERARTSKPDTFPGTVGERSNADMLVPWLDYWLECTQRCTPPRALLCSRASYSAIDRVLSVYLGGAEPAAEPRQRTRSAEIHHIRWQRDVMGCTHALDLRLAESQQPMLYVLLALDASPARSELDQIDEHPPQRLSIYIGTPATGIQAVDIDLRQ